MFPLQAEFPATQAGYVHDPLDEHQTQQPGLLHKYRSRVLLMLRSACAVNCRYCFRRHFPYGEHHLNQASLDEALR